MNSMIRLARIFLKCCYRTRNRLACQEGDVWFSLLERPELGQLQAWRVTRPHSVFMILVLLVPLLCSTRVSIVFSLVSVLRQHGLSCPGACVYTIHRPEGETVSSSKSLLVSPSPNLGHGPLLNQCCDCLNAIFWVCPRHWEA